VGRGPLDSRPFSLPFFAINVGVFLRGQPARELTILRDHFAPKGRLYLFHEPPPASTAPPITGSVPAVLASNGFTVTDSSRWDLLPHARGGYLQRIAN
jgi:hypothetical protein